MNQVSNFLPGSVQQTVPSYDDHVIISIDWSQIELVLIGDFSGDVTFAECYGTIPYRDMHIISAADCLGFTVEEFLALKRGEDPGVRPLMDQLRRPMEPAKAYKYWRTEVGKGSNFNYWYSGSLSTVGERLGWGPDEMWEATERYRQRFAGAEQWRLETIGMGQQYGFVELPDGHRRVRFEATSLWAEGFRSKFGAWLEHDGVKRFVDTAIRRIQTRANNQIVNSMIQGSCSTLAKRSIIRILAKMRAIGLTPREARFMLPIHDELLFSVHRSLVRPFIEMARAIMVDHPDIIRNLPIDCSPSVGLTFEAYDAKKAPTGQVELFEAPEIDVVPADRVGGRLDPEHYDAVVDWLFAKREAA